MLSARVPPELQDLVIDLVHDRNYNILRATLLSCSLTCRAWLPRSKRRLYHLLELWGIDGRRLDKLVVLIDRDPEVSNAVRKVRIEDAPGPKRDTVHSGAVLVVLAGKLPRLTSLILHDAAIDASPARLPMLAGFPALTSLELISVTFTSYVAFQRTIAAASGLKRLIVSNVTWRSTHISPTIQYIRLRCPSLTHLAWYLTVALSVRIQPI